MNQETQTTNPLASDNEPGKEPTYTEFVASRFKTGEATKDDIANKVKPSAVELFHAAIGMVGEAIEYQSSSDEVNIREELGDSIFFAEAAREVLLPNHPAFPFMTLVPRPGVALYTDAVAALLETANGLMDLCKKQVIYAKELIPQQIGEQQHFLMLYYAALNVIIDFHGYTADQLKAENMAKLTKRHPKGYSNESAVARADKAEGEA